MRTLRLVKGVVATPEVVLRRKDLELVSRVRLADWTFWPEASQKMSWAVARPRVNILLVLALAQTDKLNWVWAGPFIAISWLKAGRFLSLRRP